MNPRIAPLAPPYSATVAEDFQKLMPPGMEPLALFRTLAHNPRVLHRLRRGGLLNPGSISVRQREIAILRTTARAGAEYEWGVHVGFFGAAAGLDAAQLYATVWLGPDAACWRDDEAAIVRLVDELSDTAHLTDATFASLQSHFRSDQIVELLILAGLYRAVSYAVNGTGLALEPAAPRFPVRENVIANATYQGSCLCGALRYQIEGQLGEFGYCHCQSCRKASGSAHAANAPVDRARFHWVSRATLRERESSPGKTRAFCSACGSPIYAFVAASPDVLRVRLGSLDTPFHAQPRAHTFVSDKAPWEPINDSLPQFAEWAPKSVLDQKGSRQPE